MSTVVRTSSHRPILLAMLGLLVSAGLVSAQTGGGSGQCQGQGQGQQTTLPSQQANPSSQPRLNMLQASLQNGLLHLSGLQQSGQLSPSQLQAVNQRMVFLQTALQQVNAMQQASDSSPQSALQARGTSLTASQLQALRLQNAQAFQARSRSLRGRR